jgi:tRNA/rRNA methyltransferase
VILCRPQLGENIGAAARVMANFALSDLRLVAPRRGWPDARADALAAGALTDEGGVAVRLFDDLPDAIGDLSHVLAATARPREAWKPVLSPRAGIAALREKEAAGVRTGVLFGGEKAGLSNEEAALADAIVTCPVNPAFSSLNLAQAVAVIAYEWGAAATDAPPPAFDAEAPVPAPRAELEGLMSQFEDELDGAGFYWPPAKAPQMKLNLRNMLARMGLTSQEVSTFRGAIKAIAEGPRRRVREMRAREADARRAAERASKDDLES